MTTLYLKLEIPKDIELARDVLNEEASIVLSWDKGESRLVAELPDGVKVPIEGATLTFDLRDPWNRDELMACLDGSEWQNLVWELLEQKLRPLWKHGENEEMVSVADDVSSWIYEEINDRNLRFPR